jgi:hypothetical protein
MKGVVGMFERKETGPKLPRNRVKTAMQEVMKLSRKNKPKMPKVERR